MGVFGRQAIMARKRHSAEQIINKLREAEVHLGLGMSVPEVSRKLGITEQTNYRSLPPLSGPGDERSIAVSACVKWVWSSIKFFSGYTEIPIGDRPTDRA